MSNNFFAAPGSSFFPESTLNPFSPALVTQTLSTAVETNALNGSIVQSGQNIAFTVNAGAPLGPAGAVYASWPLLDPNGAQVDRGAGGLAVGLMAMRLAAIVDAGLSDDTDAIIFVSGSPTFSGTPSGVGVGFRYSGATKAALALTYENGTYFPAPDGSPSGTAQHVLGTINELFATAPGQIVAIGVDNAGNTAAQDIAAVNYNIALTGPQYVTCAVYRSVAGTLAPSSVTLRPQILATGAFQADYTFTP